MKIATDKNFYSSESNFLRSSSLKTYESCSFLYYCDYVLKIPQKSNQGASCGSICHSIFECLLNPRHKKNYDRIIVNNNIDDDKSVSRLIKKLIKRYNLSENEVLDKINKMCIVGLTTQFIVEGEELIDSEYRFKHVNKSPKYSVYGTMDKIVKKDNFIIIYDWKSSKEKFKGEDKNSNIQALLYSLVAKKLWPDKTPIIKFIFLQYPQDPIQEVSYDEETLKGFEYYLESINEKIINFTEKDAKSNFAADKGLPRDGSFKGTLSCGYSKYKGHLSKKTGKEYWACSCKWPFNYYKIFDKNTKKFLYSVLEEDFNKSKLSDDLIAEYFLFRGCPKYNSKIDDFLA